MGLLLQNLLISAFSWFIVYVLTANVDHNLFLEQIHLQELGIQIQHMHEKLYEHCPNDFQTPNSASIIGRRLSVDTSLDLKIELAEKTLEYVIQAYDKCTSTSTVMTLLTSTETRNPTTSTESTLHPTSALVQATTTYPKYTTTNRCKLLKRLLSDCLAL